VREREGLVARIRQIRRTAEVGSERSKTGSGNPVKDRIRALEARLDHLEQLLQGLQDSVHRESSRHARRIAEIDARTQPAALGKALSEDARARGL
jgi:hypothetical protein